MDVVAQRMVIDSNRQISRAGPDPREMSLKLDDALDRIETHVFDKIGTPDATRCRGYLPPFTDMRARLIGPRACSVHILSSIAMWLCTTGTIFAAAAFNAGLSPVEA